METRVHNEILLVSLVPGVSKLTERSAELLNRCQDHFVFHATPCKTQLLKPDLEDGIYSWRLLTSIMNCEKERASAASAFGILDSPIENNWFSRTDHQSRICFITTHGWEFLSSFPIESFVAFEIVENLIEMQLGYMLVHSETRGCSQDMCIHKPNISFKIRTADICDDCAATLRSRLGPGDYEAVVSMLEEVRRVALRRSSEFRVSRESSVAEVVDERFPFPIAYSFRSMKIESSYSRKWLKILETYEVLIKYLTIVLLCSVRRTQMQLPEQIISQIGALRRPSIGHWHAACFSLMDLNKRATQGNHLQRLLDLMETKSIRRARDASERLVSLRNDTRGHGFIEEEAAYQSLFEKNLPNLQTLLQFAMPLAGFPLIHVGAGLQRRSGMSRFSAKSLMGSHPLFAVINHQTKHPVDTDCLLHDPERGTYLSLFPWIVLDSCTECHREMVFLYDKCEDDHVLMREYPTNHKKQYSDDRFDAVRETLSAEVKHCE